MSQFEILKSALTYADDDVGEDGEAAQSATSSCQLVELLTVATAMATAGTPAAAESSECVKAELNYSTGVNVTA